MIKFKKITRLLLLTTGILLASIGTSYPQTLSTASGLIGFPDTVQIGDTIPFSYQVTNIGSIPIVNETLETKVDVNNQVLNTVNSLWIDSLTPFGPGDTITVSVTDYFITPQGYNNGSGNVVVVWPTSPGSTTQDSVRDTVYADNNQVNRAASQSYQGPVIYPNPAKEIIHIQTNRRKLPGYILITDLNGRLVRRTLSFVHELEISELETGVYILQLVYPEGNRHAFRFIKN